MDTSGLCDFGYVFESAVGRNKVFADGQAGAENCERAKLAEEVRDIKEKGGQIYIPHD